MEKKIRDAIDRSLEELKTIQDKVDEFIDDIPDDTKEIKQTARNALRQINELLSKAMQKAGDQADEAQLQAHLGLMEAQDKLEASKAVVDDYIARTSDESKKLLDEVELKQHLAMMEARDFWETRGSKLAEEFQASAATMQSIAEKAMGEMQTAFERWNEQFKSGK
ncbi:MAG: hypothetical protein HKN42_19115 [Granulosicoccus sp.]|nr:hypothetical protein [Granulosicoccus sp.]